MKYRGKEINESIKWQDITPGGIITGGGTSKLFSTGDWRSARPVIDWSKCKQCLLCAPVCPDSSIPVVNGSRGEFDYAHCKGCGVCSKVCPFDAIKMQKEGED